VVEALAVLWCWGRTTWSCLCDISETEN